MSSSALTLDQDVWRPKYNPWLIAVVVALAAFMEVLDTSIANVALPYMAGNLGASNDESTWVLTSYLVSNAIVLPISGWFASVLGRKRFFMTCLTIFTLSSLLCGIAPSLGAIILFRVLQGAGGGGLQPMAQGILADTFPPEKRGLAFALYGVTVVVAPTVGPTLGGWITDNYTWRWIFFINLPVGILALFMVFRLIEDPPWANRVAGAGVKIDYIGVALLTLGVGALQVMLDKGQEEDWFASHFVLTLAAVAGVGLVSLVIWEWFYKEPIVEVRLFKNLNFLGANAMMFILGIMLFSSLVMMPLFLQTLVGYTAESAGLVLSVAGLVNFMRNIGSSIGTSMVTTLISRRAQFHQVYLAAHATAGHPVFVQAVRGLAARLAASGMDTSRATRQAYGMLYRALLGQATTLAYIDTFWVLCVGSGIMFILSFALKRNEPGAGG